MVFLYAMLTDRNRVFATIVVEENLTLFIRDTRDERKYRSAAPLNVSCELKGKKRESKSYQTYIGIIIDPIIIIILLGS
jgi:hypothetical protein